MRGSERLTQIPASILVSQSSKKQVELSGDQPICPVKAVEWRSCSSHVRIVVGSSISAGRVSTAIDTAASHVVRRPEMNKSWKPGVVTG